MSSWLRPGRVGVGTAQAVMPMSEKDFSGRLAFISGAASGIGRDTAIELGRRGMKVAVADIDVAGAERVAAQIEGASAVRLDVSDAESWTLALNEAEERHGPLAVLFSNAGVMGSMDPVSQTSQAAWEWSRSVNLDGNFYGLTQGRHRITASGLPGHLIATASLAVLNTNARTGVYTAMKAGVVALCEALRDELKGSGTKVSVLLPGPVNTALLERNAARAPAELAMGEQAEHLVELLRGGLDPAEVATLVADAVGTERFWLFPNRDLEDRIDTRAADMKSSFFMAL